jgi:transcriptional regulator with XRE-family HTH domain
VNEIRRKEDRQQCANRSTHLPSLRAVRRSKGWTQRELADLAGVSRGSIYRLENGLRGAYPVTVQALARALGVPPAELVLGRRRE